MLAIAKDGANARSSPLVYEEVNCIFIVNFICTIVCVNIQNVGLNQIFKFFTFLRKNGHLPGMHLPGMPKTLS
jgi:hypothetical protein